MHTISLQAILFKYTVDQLKGLVDMFPNSNRSGTKDKLVNVIVQGLLGDNLLENKLEQIWSSLDPTQRLAVTEAAYHPEGIYVENQFIAKHGSVPAFSNGKKYSSYEARGWSALHLFLHDCDSHIIIPCDIAKRIQLLTTQPAPYLISAISSPPAQVADLPLTIRLTESEAIHDLFYLLRLIEQGKIHVSDKTGISSKTTQSLLAKHLSGGDYYSNADNLGDLALTVKAFSWPLLLQSSGLVQINGTKLALKPAGLKASTGQPALILQSIWTKWLKANDFDEFSRIDTIKGQKTKSRHMSNVSNRRLSIVAALKKCPINDWIALDDFSRFMQAENFSFQVSHDPWKLYICDQQYGNLGYQDSHDWNILQLRYLLCFLFEYAAPLGLIDIAFTSPVGTRHDYGNLWGTDDLDFLSQYDGLHYFKINPLGAYCLQMSAHYQPTSIPSAIELSLIGDSAIKLVQGSMSGEELLRMEVWSVQESESLWRLNKAKVVQALEQGREISEIINFLQSRDEQPMPPAMENFFKLCSKHGNALKTQGMARIIQCRTQEIASSIEQHPETIKLCQRISELQLLVPVRNEEKFRAATRMLGFGFEGGF